MINAKKIVKALQDDPAIKRFKELEQVIDQDETLSNAYRRLLELQKKLVQAKYYKSSEFNHLKKQYEKQYKQIQSHLIIDEYLELVDYVNQEIEFIQRMIEEAIESDLESSQSK